jgi:hypothetical protein
MGEPSSKKSTAKPIFSTSNRTSSYRASRSEANLRRPELWSGSRHGCKPSASCIFRYPATSCISSNPRNQIAPCLSRSCRIFAAFLAKYAAPSAFICGVARTSSGHAGAFRACFCASTTLILYIKEEKESFEVELVAHHGLVLWKKDCRRTYPSESHLVNGHSHISERSGCDKSESRKFSFPGRFSHVGLDPAPGASRTGGASTSTVALVDTNALVEDDGDGIRTKELANGHAKAATSANDLSFIVTACGYSGAFIEGTEPDRSAI